MIRGRLIRIVLASCFFATGAYAGKFDDAHAWVELTKSPESENTSLVISRFYGTSRKRFDRMLEGKTLSDLKALSYDALLEVMARSEDPRFKTSWILANKEQFVEEDGEHDDHQWRQWFEISFQASVRRIEAKLSYSMWGERRLKLGIAAATLGGTGAAFYLGTEPSILAGWMGLAFAATSFSDVMGAINRRGNAATQNRADAVMRELADTLMTDASTPHPVPINTDLAAEIYRTVLNLTQQIQIARIDEPMAEAIRKWNRKGAEFSQYPHQVSLRVRQTVENFMALAKAYLFFYMNTLPKGELASDYLRKAAGALIAHGVSMIDADSHLGWDDLVEAMGMLMENLVTQVKPDCVTVARGRVVHSLACSIETLGATERPPQFVHVAGSAMSFRVSAELAYGLALESPDRPIKASRVAALLGPGLWLKFPEWSRDAYFFYPLTVEFRPIDLHYSGPILVRDMQLVPAR